MIALQRKTREKCIALLCLVLSLPKTMVDSFVPFVSKHRDASTSIFLSGVDYEYIPPNPDAQPPLEWSPQLSSVYPEGTPAGLRGEAVRSALRSTRCIAWRLDNTEQLDCGWIQVQGKGTRDFLANKLSQNFVVENNASGKFVKACLLTPKGRLVDQISVAMVSPEQAFMLTSPLHGGQALFDRLNPLIFPMDQVVLENQSDNSTIFSVASTSLQHVQDAIQKYAEPLLQNKLQDKSTWAFPPSAQECLHVNLQDTGSFTVIPHIHIPQCACQGYTFVFHNNNKLASAVWSNMVGEESTEGPVEIGALEYETLRIEAGQPGYGKEITAGLKKDKEKEETKKEMVPSNPIELHWQDDYVDLEKGCYLGQEGIASILKNPRGPARTLYSVIFEDDTNVYNHQSEGAEGETPNLTVVPQVGNDLYVLGSNEKISVGTLTSVAEPGGTGDATTVALALIRRADSILKQMKDMDLEVGSSYSLENDPLWTGNTLDKPDQAAAAAAASGIIQPPPMDPLDGLEVIVGGTYTVGVLKSIPSRQFLRGQNMFLEGFQVPDFDDMEGSVMGYGPVSVERTAPRSDQEILDAAQDMFPDTSNAVDVAPEEDLERAVEDAKKAQEEAEAAAAEAKRKAEKMEMLKRRAEEAMARRRNKKQD